MVLNKYIVTLIYSITSQLSIITIRIACNYHHSSYWSTPYSKFEDGDHNQDKTPYFFPINGRKVKLTTHSFQHQCPENIASKLLYHQEVLSSWACHHRKQYLICVIFLTQFHQPTNQPLSSSSSPIPFTNPHESRPRFGLWYDIAGLTPIIHKELVEVSTTLNSLLRCR